MTSRSYPFFLITYALTWATWLAVATLSGGAGILGVQGPLFLLGVFAPSLVALALTALAEGSDGVGRLLARVARWRVEARYYVFALIYFAAIKMAAALVHRVVTGEWPRFGEIPGLWLLAAILASTAVQLGEELGWRGYALPRLARRFGLPGASVMLGLLWAFWHLPLFFMVGTGSTGQSFVVYLLQVTAVSVAMGWLYWRTDGSLLLVMLMHAAMNNTTGMVPAAVPGARDPITLQGSIVAWATVLLAWAVAIPLLLRMRGADVRAMMDGGMASSRQLAGRGGTRSAPVVDRLGEPPPR